MLTQFRGWVAGAGTRHKDMTCVVARDATRSCAHNKNEAEKNAMSRANAAPLTLPAGANVAPLRARPAPRPQSPDGQARWNIRLWLRSTRFVDAWPEDGLAVPRLPFVVGRLPEAHEQAPRDHVDLRLPDHAPYRLSRVHFCLMMFGDAIAVMDTNSHCGTVVNGVTIGRGRPSNHALLVSGTNRVVVGRRDEPFVFEITVP